MMIQQDTILLSIQGVALAAWDDLKNRDSSFSTIPTKCLANRYEITLSRTQAKMLQAFLIEREEKIDNARSAATNNPTGLSQNLNPMELLLQQLNIAIGEREGVENSPLLGSAINLPLKNYFPVDLKKNTLRLGNRDVRLPPALIVYLQVLLKYPASTLISQEEIISHVYGKRATTPGNFHAQMCYLRGKLEPEIIITTFPREGYSVTIAQPQILLTNNQQPVFNIPPTAEIPVR